MDSKQRFFQIDEGNQGGNLSGLGVVDGLVSFILREELESGETSDSESLAQVSLVVGIDFSDDHAVPNE